MADVTGTSEHLLEVRIDHLIVAAATLKSGSQFLAAHFGAFPTAGGSHPGQGTRNALLSLEEDCYLEVLAPDPGQAQTPLSDYLSTMENPALLWWAARVDDLDPVERALADCGLTSQLRAAGSRALPDHQGTLRWELLLPKAGPEANAAPFFIAWSSLAEHPARRRPVVGRLRRLSVLAPAGGILPLLTGPSLHLQGAAFSSIRAEFDTPQGAVTLMSPGQTQPVIGDFR